MKLKTTPVFKRNPQPDMADANRLHSLLIGLIAGENEQFYADSLTTGAGHDTLSILLASATKIKDSAGIRATFDFLKEEGERCAYDLMIPFFLSEKEEEMRVANIRSHFTGIERLADYSKNLNDFLEYTHSHHSIRITHKDLQRGILAWDLGRLVTLARIAGDYRLIDEKEAWDYIEFAGKECHRHFTCWKEVGKSYLLGYILHHTGEEEYEKIIRLYRLATENKASPWREINY